MNTKGNFDNEGYMYEQKHATNPSDSNRRDFAAKQFEDKRINLTPEERRVLKNINREAAIKRGYPLAFLLGGTTYVGLGRLFPKMPAFGKLGIVSLVGIFGNLVGKISYIPVAFEKFETDLPPDSQLRELVENMKNRMKNNPNNYNKPHSSEAPLSFPSLSSVDNPSIPVVDNSELPVPSSANTNKAATYEELRRQHREKEKSSQFPVSQYADIPTDSNRKVRYNKYGDPILE